MIVLERALASCGDRVGDALPEYERTRAADSKALVRVRWIVGSGVASNLDLVVQKSRLCVDAAVFRFKRHKRPRCLLLLRVRFAKNPVSGLSSGLTAIGCSVCAQFRC